MKTNGEQISSHSETDRQFKKNTMKSKIPCCISAIFCLLVGGALSAFAQGTTFTYQGRVTDNGTDFTGAGQFQFALVTSTNFNHTATATANPPSGGFITGYAVTSGGSG